MSLWSRAWLFASAAAVAAAILSIGAKADPQSSVLPPIVVQQPKSSPHPRPEPAKAPRARVERVRTTPKIRRPPRVHAVSAPTTKPSPVAPVVARTSPSPAAAVQGQGSAAAGYKVQSVAAFGPLGEKPVLDLPYTVTVVPQALLQNTITVRPDDLYTITPGVQTLSTDTRNLSPNFILRGFRLVNGQGTAEDGLRFQNLFIEPLEDKERVEIYSGLTSFLFGPNNVGGLADYVYKRPTFTQFEDVTFANPFGSTGFVHGDIGGPIVGSDSLFYRVNLVGQDGGTGVTTQSIKRNVLTGALSWRPSGNFDFTIIGSHINQEVHGADPGFNFATNPNGSSAVPHGTPPNPALNFGQPFAQYAGDRDRIGADLTAHITPGLTFRTGYAFNNVSFTNNISVNNNITNTSGLYDQQAFKNADFYYLANSGYSALDGEFDTGFIHHKVTVGYYANDFEQREAPTTYAPVTFQNLNFVTPTYFPLPAFAASNLGPVRLATENTQQNAILGDDVRFNQYWSALLGANYATIAGQNFSTTTGQTTSSFDQSALSPSLSLIFKPVPWVSTYATYSESLQNGENVSSSSSMIFTNSGETLAPYLGRSVELGIKANVGATLVTLALYDINQALEYNQYNDNGTYTAVENGRQDDKGIDITAVGTVFPGFRIFSGATFLDPRVTQSMSSASIPSLDGLRPQGISSVQAKLTAEYDLPVIKGLTLTGGVYYFGSQPADILDSDYLPAFTTEDVGFRYTVSESATRQFILRFDVHNVSDQRYWLTYNYVGQPRTFALSGEAHF